MKERHLIGILIIIILVSIMTSTITAAVISESISGGPIQATGPNVTFVKPTSDEVETRQQIEERILNSTIRFYIETWAVRPGDSGYDFDSASGHGTLKDGRYLVTHNHFSAPLSSQSHDRESNAYTMVTLTDSNGEALFKGPVSDFEVVWEDPETLVITHKDSDLFQKLGFVSAEFKQWSSVPLEAGMEVAQVDWDGATTRVDWTTVQEVTVNEGTPRLVLADDVTLGASGGGIFWQGVHIANNWLLVQELGASGELLSATTKVALNSAPVASTLSQAAASS